MALTLVVGVGVGLLAARLIAGGGLGGGEESVVSELDPPGASASAPQERPDPPDADAVVDVAEADSPEAAVEGFLTAEAQQDFATSFTFLSEVDRQTWPSPEAWVSGHADLPPVSSFEVEEASDTAVTTFTGLRSTLDQVIGLVPARARARWAVTEEDDGWRVVYTQSELTPLYPSDEGVAAAAQAWAESKATDCGDEAQYAGVLIGSAGLSRQLCEEGGEVALGEVGGLRDGTNSTPFLNAFGPEVFTWARTVTVTAPVELVAVLAPIDDTWQVIGVVPAN